MPTQIETQSIHWYAKIDGKDVNIFIHPLFDTLLRSVPPTPT